MQRNDKVASFDSPPAPRSRPAAPERYRVPLLLEALKSLLDPCGLGACGSLACAEDNGQSVDWRAEDFVTDKIFKGLDNMTQPN
jgi:hypothetical protein